MRVLGHNGEINTLRGNVNWYVVEQKGFGYVLSEWWDWMMYCITNKDPSEHKTMHVLLNQFVINTIAMHLDLDTVPLFPVKNACSWLKLIIVMSSHKNISYWCFAIIFIG